MSAANRPQSIWLQFIWHASFFGFQFPGFNRDLSIKGDDGSGPSSGLRVNFPKLWVFLCQHGVTSTTLYMQVKMIKGIALDFGQRDILETQNLNRPTCLCLCSVFSDGMLTPWFVCLYNPCCGSYPLFHYLLNNLLTYYILVPWATVHSTVLQPRICEVKWSVITGMTWMRHYIPIIVCVLSLALVLIIIPQCY